LAIPRKLCPKTYKVLVLHMFTTPRLRSAQGVLKSEYFLKRLKPAYGRRDCLPAQNRKSKITYNQNFISSIFFSLAVNLKKQGMPK